MADLLGTRSGKKDSGPAPHPEWEGGWTAQENDPVLSAALPQAVSPGPREGPRVSLAQGFPVRGQGLLGRSISEAPGGGGPEALSR